MELRLLEGAASIRNSHDDRCASNVLEGFSSAAEGGSAMTDRDDGIGDANSGDVAVCVRTLNHAIGQLANRYGASSVVAALVEVVGCSICMHDANRRGTS